MLGHELRNPLSPILAVLDLMAMREPTTFVRERDLMGRQVNHLVRLVDDLLDVSRISGGKIELRREPIELGEIVSRAVEMVNPLLEQKTHTLTINVAPRGLPVDGDATRLTQVVGNLLTNAAKYTPEGGSIAVTGERWGTNLMLRVRDTGIGISQEMLPRVFELFAQERRAIDRSRGGLGLGLAIVRTLITMHGGTVTAHSDGIGHGSEFVVELPAAVPQTNGAAMSARVRDAVAAEARKILVIDDHRDLAEAQAQVLGLLGHEVRVAVDGPSALAICKDFVPDVVLVDIGLPVMDGYEVANRLRALLSPREIPIIAISGYGQEIDHHRSQEAGFECHLVKPVDVESLQLRIRAATQSP